MEDVFIGRLLFGGRRVCDLGEGTVSTATVGEGERTLSHEAHRLGAVFGYVGAVEGSVAPGYIRRACTPRKVENQRGF